MLHFMRSHMPSMLFLGAVFSLGLSFLLFGHPVSAAPGSIPATTYGHIALTGGVATKVPATSMSGRYGVAILNNGPEIIYCGWDSSVTATSGWPVTASGGTLSVELSYDGQSGRGQLFCTVADTQTSPADTRYLEVR